LKDYQTFLEDHEEKWRTKIGDVLVDLLKEAKQPIENELIPKLEEVAETVQENTRALSDAGKDFTSYHREWKQTQDEALGSWIKTSEKIESAAQSLGGSEKQLLRAAAILESSAGELERIAQLEEAFEKNLRESLGRVTADYLGEVRSVLDEMEKRRQRYDTILERQTEIIVELINRAVERYPRSQV
jgi:hypothetical protein